MMFFNIELLKPTYLILKPPIISEKIKKYFGTSMGIPEYKVEFKWDYTLAVITLQSKNFYFGRITLNTVSANCGSLFISDLYVKYQRLGIGTSILKEVENYALKAGYTMIFGNIPKYHTLLSNNDPMRFFEKMEYKPMGENYVNVRSGNINRWFSKIIRLPQEDNEE